MSSEPFCNSIVRRMVSLPRTLMGGFSRVIGRRNFHQPLNFHLQFPQKPLIVPEEWAFLASFEQQYGSTHPFFFACKFSETSKIAEEEGKFMFMYLHSPGHPFTPSFCRNTLCSELIVQFLDANFVCWGALADRVEGLKMAAALQPASFPFCAVVYLANDHSLAVLQQVHPLFIVYGFYIKD
ncbi:LOW QUALITY PROTEIN: plant UBX domain-containing protein 10-like [Carica papaya]|uniref:LOW QUALITY PROTEIN: plant UBX domain-containing protein 10-like n=1 Tax=Carica papaya TaxID=3649 RepID=UPI000B8CEC8F|nr:LOW QUALITY PROTEIN: plant UBX domain-containing protein 10-like [Carica papaya]